MFVMAAWVLPEHNVMTGQSKITYSHLEKMGAYNKGLAAFKQEYPVEKYPEGIAYQDVLDWCAEKNHTFGVWLFTKLGSTEDVRIFNKYVDDPRKTIIFPGSIKFKYGVQVRTIFVGRNIEAYYSIKADSSIEAGGSVKTRGHIEAGFDIKAGGNIRAGTWVKADLMNIEVGGNIEADGSIEAGSGIEAGGYIKAGEDYGVFAGLRTPVSCWPQRAKVIAKEQPKNLMTGYWAKTNKLDDEI